jgi:RNA polymerase sigma factor (sigma-70 family)
MTGAPFHLVLRHLRQQASSPGPGRESDGELLRRYAARGDEAAFEELLRRHGPKVLQVGRRLLGHGPDAEDVFQATFLTLAQQARSVRQQDSVGCWLHGVARRLALRVRTGSARRRARERRRPSQPPGDVLGEITLREARAVLDEELDGLAESLRAPLVLCYLEGLTQDEAARRLHWSTSTLRRRLETGRQVLSRRLARRGVTLSAVLLPALLAGGGPCAGASAALTKATLRAASFAARGATAGAVSARVGALLPTGPGVAALARWKIAALLLAVVGVCAAGAGWATRAVLAGQPAEAEKQADRESAAKGPDRPGRGTAGAARTDYYGDPLPPGVLARLGSARLRHPGAHVTFSGDGKTLTSAGTDGVVQVWDLATGRSVRRLQVAQPGRLAELSPDGRHVASWGGEAVSLHDTRSGKELHRLPVGLSSRENLAFAPDGTTLATMASLGGRSVVRLWDVATGTERMAFKKGVIDHFAFSPDGKVLAMSATDGASRLCLFDTATGAELRSVRAGRDSLTFAPDGRSVAATDRLGAVTLWETATLKKHATLKPSRASWDSSASAYSPDGRLLAVAGEEDLVLWDVAGPREQKRLPERKARRLAFTPDGKTLACAGAFEIHLWDVATGERRLPRPGHDSDVWSVAVSPDGKTVASAAWDDPAVRLWEAATGKPLGTGPRHDRWVRSCAFSPDGALLVAGEGTLRLLVPATGQELRRFVVEGAAGAPRSQEVLVAHVSADGRRLAAVSTGGGRDDCQMSVWDARTGESLVRRRFRGFLGSRFTPDGSGVTVKGAGLVIEETATGRERTTIPGNLGQPVAFSPDGQLIAAGIHESVKEDPHGWRPLGVRVAEVVTGKEVFHIDGAIDFTAFSPDGRQLVTADPRAFCLWNPLTGEQLFRRAWPGGLVPAGRRTPIGSLALLPDGRAVATGMGDGTVLVWDLAPETWPATGLKKSLGRQDLDRLWSDLAGDAGPAHRAIATLTTVPEEAVPFLAKRLRPVAAPDPEQVRRLLADLDSDQFTMRQAAARALSSFGEQIQPALRQVLQGEPSAELRRQVEALLEASSGPPPAPTLRVLRAVRVLEGVGTTQARRALERLAAGDPPARVTREATKALERLKMRTGSR